MATTPSLVPGFLSEVVSVAKEGQHDVVGNEESTVDALEPIREQQPPSHRGRDTAPTTLYSP